MPNRGGGKLSEIKGFSPNNPVVSNSFLNLCVILNLFQTLLTVMLNLFQHLKNFIYRIGLYKFANQVRNNNEMISSVAFTLAETLITIGMIGVIAALTLPTLMNSTNDKEIVARVKKTHAALNEAYGRAYAKYGPVNTWYQASDTTDALKSQRVAGRITEFMQVEKDCGTGTGCWTNSSLKSISGSDTSNLNTSTAFYKVLLADGTSLAFNYNPGNKTTHVSFDIDGPNKGKNMHGVDFFNAKIYDDGVMPNKDINDRGNAAMWSKTSNGSGSGDWTLCLAWVLSYDNVDYLHTDSSGKCPNGATLNSSNPTCN